MTDNEALREIEKQEKRFAASCCASGKMLVKSARDYFKLLKDAEKKFEAVEGDYRPAKASLAKLEAAVKAAEDVIRRKTAEVKKFRGEMTPLRKTVKNGDSLKSKVNVARIRLAEKLKVLKTMSVE